MDMGREGKLFSQQNFQLSQQKVRTFLGQNYVRGSYNNFCPNLASRRGAKIRYMAGLGLARARDQKQPIRIVQSVTSHVNQKQPIKIVRVSTSLPRPSRPGTKE